MTLIDPAAKPWVCQSGWRHPKTPGEIREFQLWAGRKQSVPWVKLLYYTNEREYTCKSKSGIQL